MGSDSDAVAPVFFGAIEGGVSASEEGIDIQFGGKSSGDAEACRHLHALVLPFDLQSAERPAKALRHLSGTIERRFRQQRDELFAAVPSF